MKEEQLNTLRVLAGIFAFITALGWLWFASSFDWVWHIYAATNALAFIVAAVVPYRAYLSRFRFLCGGLYLCGAATSVPIIIEDFNATGGPEYDVIALRISEILLLVALAIVAFITRQGKNA